MTIKHINKQKSGWNIDIHSLGIKILFLLIFLSLTLPTSITLLKIGILFCLIFLLIINKDKIVFDKEIFLLTLLYTLVGFVWSFYGLLFDNPGGLRVLTVMGIYPLLFLALSFWITIYNINNIAKLFFVISIFIVVIQASFILSSLGILPLFIYDVLKTLSDNSDGISIGDAHILFTLPNVSSLIFLIPFFSAFILLSNKLEIKSLILVLVMLVLILLTGRRAFFLSYGFSLVFLVFISLYLRKDLQTNIFRKLFVVMLFFVMSLFAFISFSGIELQIYIEKFYSILDFSSNDSNLERVYQFRALYEGIANTPLFGSGAGAAAEYTRSSEQPWAYELSYVAFIFHYGMLGFMIYLSGIVYIFVSLLKICKDKIVSRDVKVSIVSFLAGFVAFLVANSTNPYLMKFDYMWVIFIPVMIINAYKIEKGEQLAKNI